MTAQPRKPEIVSADIVGRWRRLVASTRARPSKTIVLALMDSHEELRRQLQDAQDALLVLTRKATENPSERVELDEFLDDLGLGDDLDGTREP